jgi:hypothetical protein
VYKTLSQHLRTLSGFDILFHSEVSFHLCAILSIWSVVFMLTDTLFECLIFFLCATCPARGFLSRFTSSTVFSGRVVQRTAFEGPVSELSDLDHVLDSRVCPYCPHLCCPVCVEVLRCADPPRKVSYRRSVRSGISEANSEATQNVESELDRRVSQSAAECTSDVRQAPSVCWSRVLLFGKGQHATDAARVKKSDVIETIS